MLRRRFPTFAEPEPLQRRSSCAIPRKRADPALPPAVPNGVVNSSEKNFDQHRVRTGLVSWERLIRFWQTGS